MDHATPTTPSQQDDDGLKIINASIFRMATKSMAQAYIILGFKTHHGLLEDVMDTPWALIERAAEATWPDVPGAPSTPRPRFERADWSAIWGAYDAVTDLASPFAPQLARAFPSARVVVVQRDFDSWWPSFRSQLRDTVMREPQSSLQAFITSRVLGIRPVHASRKIILGFCGARTRLEVDEARARTAYDAYFREVRELVPAERRLEYEMGSGWEPLCEFLGVEVPDVPFPQANDRVAHDEESRSRHVTFLVNAVRMLGPWVLGALAVGGGAWLYAR
ncbi:hypothetical protein F4778DRAFT_675369 [Xylariomycetidae sp. FL2044]|nr:hypothetical protein F4778DRAFT_675369 [Xylariomycetidae sp. FL2044]